MNEPKVSVIIPVLNRRTLLPRALRSVASQNWHPLEIIVVDNGSTDGTYEDALKIAEEYNSMENLKVKVIREPEAGASRARNKGFHNATGDIILFFDSDDVMLEGSLEAYVNAFRRNPKTDLVVSKSEILYSHGRKKKLGNRHGNRAVNHFHHCILNTSRYASTRKFLLKAQEKYGDLWSEHLGVWDDWALGFRLVMMEPRITEIDKIVTQILPQENSITGNAFCTVAPERYLAAIADVQSTIELHKSKRNRKTKKELAGWHNLLLYRRVMLAALLARESKTISDEILEKSPYFSREELKKESRRLLHSALREAPTRRMRFVLNFAYRYISSGFRGCATILTPLMK